MVQIYLFQRKELTGTLSPRFSELPDLQVLVLGYAGVSGDLLALKSLTKLRVLDLRDTNVIGDMSSLRSTSLVDDFYIEGTEIEITCPQEEPLKEVLMTLGLAESQLENLHDVRGVAWRLNLQSGKPFDNFCVVFGGSCSPLLGIFQTQQEICQQKRLLWDL